MVLEKIKRLEYNPELKKIAVIDADLISQKGHRFPNLACMKISAYYKKRGCSVVLKTDYKDLAIYDTVFISKVFTNTPVEEYILALPNVIYGGTGFFYDRSPKLPAAIEHHFPDYTLYDNWVDEQLANGKNKRNFKYYKNYSIGFLTRGCFRKCDFCVNRNYNKVKKHASLEEFLDRNRKRICLLDDNFLGYPQWKRLLIGLQETNKPFQFNQGLDIRLLTKEKGELIFSSKYDGDYIFAFDDINDAATIEPNIQLMRNYTNKVLKFYVLCAYDRKGRWNKDFWVQDIFDIFSRIEILMRNKCIPYIMRFERYKDSPFRGMYISIARWCNQPALFKKKSLREFAFLNGNNSGCFKYIVGFEALYPEAAYFYDLKFEDMWKKECANAGNSI